jgi:ADP-ribosylglycohydrolase
VGRLDKETKAQDLDRGANAGGKLDAVGAILGALAQRWEEQFGRELLDEEDLGDLQPIEYPQWYIR